MYKTFTQLFKSHIYSSLSQRVKLVTICYIPNENDTLVILYVHLLH